MSGLPLYHNGIVLNRVRNSTSVYPVASNSVPFFENVNNNSNKGAKDDHTQTFF